MGKRNYSKFQGKKQPQPTDSNGEPEKAPEETINELREAIQVLAVNRCPVQVEGRPPISSGELHRVGKEWYGGVLRRVDKATWEWDPQWDGAVLHVGDNGKTVEVPSYSAELAPERAALLVVAAALALNIPPAVAKTLPPAAGFVRRAAAMKNRDSTGAPLGSGKGQPAAKAPSKAGQPPVKPGMSGPADPVLVSTRHEQQQLKKKLELEGYVPANHVLEILKRLIKQATACLKLENTFADKPAARRLLSTLLGLQGQCRDPKKMDVVARNAINSLGGWVGKREKSEAAAAPTTKSAMLAAAKAAVASAARPSGPTGLKPKAAAPGSKWSTVPVAKEPHKLKAAAAASPYPTAPGAKAKAKAKAGALAAALGGKEHGKGATGKGAKGLEHGKAGAAKDAWEQESAGKGWGKLATSEKGGSSWGPGFDKGSSSWGAGYDKGGSSWGPGYDKGGSSWDAGYEKGGWGPYDKGSSKGASGGKVGGKGYGKGYEDYDGYAGSKAAGKGGWSEAWPAAGKGKGLGSWKGKGAPSPIDIARMFLGV